MKDQRRESNCGTPFRGLSVVTLADNLKEKGRSGDLHLPKLLFLWPGHEAK